MAGKTTQESASEHRKKRLKVLRRSLNEGGASALLVTHEQDIRYLTGFVGESSWAMVLARSNKVYILSDSRFEEEIPQQAPEATAVIPKPRGMLSEEVSKIVKRHRLTKVAIQPAYLTVAQRQVLAKKVGARTLVAMDDGLPKQRAIKDSGELALIRRAIRIQEEAFKRTCEYIEPGRTEGQIAGYLEMQMRALGAEGSAFPTIVASGANSSKPHYTPGTRKVRNRGTVLIDWGATYAGYRSDMTRVLALGKMPRRITELYKIVLEAQLTAIDALQPGIALADVDKACRQVIEKAGHGERFGHGLGHGIGLDIHEGPALSPMAKGVLEPGQVVTVEPGIYLPGIGGVRIEDDVLVTERGCKVLCDLPKSLQSAIL